MTTVRINYENAELDKAIAKTEKIKADLGEAVRATSIPTERQFLRQQIAGNRRTGGLLQAQRLQVSGRGGAQALFRNAPASAGRLTAQNVARRSLAGIAVAKNLGVSPATAFAATLAGGAAAAILAQAVATVLEIVRPLIAEANKRERDLIKADLELELDLIRQEFAFETGGTNERQTRIRRQAAEQAAAQIVAETSMRSAAERRVEDL